MTKRVRIRIRDNKQLRKWKQRTRYDIALGWKVPR